MKIDLNKKVKVFLNILFPSLILINIIIDLYYTGTINYGIIIGLVIALVFVNVVE